MKCECGSESVGSLRHSDYCPKSDLHPKAENPSLLDDYYYLIFPMTGLSAWLPHLPAGKVTILE